MKDRPEDVRGEGDDIFPCLSNLVCRLPYFTSTALALESAVITLCLPVFGTVRLS